MLGKDKNEDVVCGFLTIYRVGIMDYYLLKVR